MMRRGEGAKGSQRRHSHRIDARQPYAVALPPIYAARASGAHKWDVEGNEYVDYFSGIVLLEALRESMP